MGPAGLVRCTGPHRDRAPGRSGSGFATPRRSTGHALVCRYRRGIPAGIVELRPWHYLLAAGGRDPALGNWQPTSL